MEKNATRFGYLDALRGFAAYAVIYFHAGYDATKAGTLDHAWERSIFWLTSYGFDLGKVAVTLFFAISGFVIPFSLKRDGGRPVEAFVIGRFFRLYPAYWLSIVGAIFVNYWMVGQNFSTAQLLINLTMLQGFVGQKPMQGLFWTLQIELIFYALCVALFVFGNLRSPKTAFRVAIVMLAGAIAAGALRFLTGKAVPVAIPLALFVMFIGMLWRLAIIEQDVRARRSVAILLSLFVIVMPVVAYFAYDEGALRYTITYYLAIGIFLLFTTRIKLQNRVLSFLGRISYSVYLFGSLVQLSIDHYFGAALRAAGVPLHASILLSMLLATIVAALVYRLVEAPAIEAGRAVVRNRLRTAPKAVDAVAL